ncbi:hypothetical protein Hanom_Chr10g00897311 [Helianthus anomalus]
MKTLPLVSFCLQLKHTHKHTNTPIFLLHLETLKPFTPTHNRLSPSPPFPSQSTSAAQKEGLHLKPQAIPPFSLL